MTAIEEMNTHLEVLNKILHPDYAGKLQMTFNRAMAEVRKESKDLVIPKEMQELATAILDYKRSVEHFGNANKKGLRMLFMKKVVLKIDQLYGIK